MKEITLSCESLCIDSVSLMTSTKIGEHTGHDFFSFFVLLCVSEKAIKINLSLDNNVSSRSFAINDDDENIIYSDLREATFIVNFFEEFVLSGLSSRHDCKPCCFDGYIKMTLADKFLQVRFIYTFNEKLSINLFLPHLEDDLTQTSSKILNKLYK